jgi:hypothetical protein
MVRWKILGLRQCPEDADTRRRLQKAVQAFLRAYGTGLKTR